MGFVYTVLLALLLVTAAYAQQIPADGLVGFAAVIRLDNHSTTQIKILAHYLEEARQQIINWNCGGEECIVAGPWLMAEQNGTAVPIPH